MRGTVLLRLLAAVFILGTFACGGGSDSTALSVSLQGPTASERGEYHELTATISNTDGGVANWSAKFAFEQNQSGGTLNNFDVVTDINGQAKSLYQAGNTPGVDIVQVEFQNYAKALLVITVAGGGSPASNVGRITLTVLGQARDGTGALIPDTRVIRATVWDIHGNLLSGALVNFSSTYGWFEEPAVETNANGIAESILYSTRDTSVHVTAGGLRDRTTVAF